MHKLRMFPFVVALISIGVAGCFNPTPPRQSGNPVEIHAFFDLYEHRYETQDIDGMLELYRIPVTLSDEESGTEITFNNEDALRVILESRSFANSIIFVLDNTNVIVESTEFSGSNATAKVLIASDVTEEFLGEEIACLDTASIEMTMRKSGGDWKIHAEHWIDSSFECDD